MIQPDYRVLLDEEIWAYMDRSDSFYPPDAVSLTIDQQRAVYNRMCAAFHQPHPDGVRTWDVAFGGVPCRVYEADISAITVVYYHGGGFIVGGLDSHDDVCAEICAATGYDVIAVDYRLAPEHRHPAMFDDALVASRHVFTMSRQPVLLCGDSAGGNLAAAVAHTLRNTVTQITGQLLIYPALGGDSNTGSYLRHAFAPMLSRDDVLFYEKIRVEGQPPTGDPTYAPLKDRDFSGLPPTIVISAECDPLSDDSHDYCQRIVAAGGRSRWVNEERLVHGYLRARHSVPRAQQSFARITSALHDLGRGVWPGDD